MFWSADAGTTPGFFESWNAGEPNNHDDAEHCAEVDANGGWNDLGCNGDLRRFVCDIGE